MRNIEAYDISQSALLADMTTCLNHYRLSTPGLYVCVRPQVQFCEDVLVEPSLIGQVNSGKNKQCHTGDEGGAYDRFFGPPNFVFDVFKKGDDEIYQDRRCLFEEHGVIEYVAWFSSKRLPIWNRLIEGKYEEIEKDAEDLIKSSSLPGLWFPISALAHTNMFVILAKISQGISRREHHEFMKTVWKKKS